MRKRTWKDYNQNLVNRGRVTFYIDEESLDTAFPKKPSRGRPRLYSHPLIQLLLILKIQYRLSYRALEGFAKDILPLFKLDIQIPSYSVICRRASELEALLPKLSNRRPQVIMLDASGMKIFGEGEWKIRMHGQSKRRKWVKFHLAVDAATQEILQLEVTDGHVADCEIGPKLIEKCPRSVKTVMADGAYDTKKCRIAAKQRGAQALIPPRRNARCDVGQLERNLSIRERLGLGHDKVGLSLWGMLTGYSRRSLVEASFSRIKRIYGPSLYSRKRSTQTVEGHMKCLMMNKVIARAG